MNRGETTGGGLRLLGVSPRAWIKVLVDAWNDAGEDNLSLIAAGVAFYAFLAFVPLLTAMVLTYGLVAEPASVVHHMHDLTTLMPASAAGVIGDQLKAMTETSGPKTGVALLLAIAIALYGASKGADAIMTALNIAFEVTEARGFVHRALLALGMAAGAVLALVAAVLAISALNFIEALLPELGGVSEVLLKAAFFAGAGAAVALLLALAYRYGPNRPDAPWRWITPGSLLATLVWMAATLGFGVYVANFGNYNATYGSLGAIIVFLTWLYLSAYVMLFGAELNAALESDCGDDPQPPHAPAPPAPRREHESPTAAAVATRLGGFSLLAALLGRRRPR
jgi:membrane protein